MSMPAWMAKYPCESCGTGYGNCSEGWRSNLMCCSGCSHPTLPTRDRWTVDELIEMWAGKDMPTNVRQYIEAARR